MKNAPQTGRIARGSLLVLGIFGVALGLGGYAWWHAFERGKLSLRLWGSDGAVLIRYATRVELLEWPETLDTLDGLTLPVAAIAEDDISRVRGLVHARHALVEDASYDWDRAQDDCRNAWSFALRFEDDGSGPTNARSATLVFDTACNQVRMLENNQQATLKPHLMKAFSKKIPAWQREAE